MKRGGRRPGEDAFRPVTALPDLLQHAIAAAFSAGRDILDVYARPTTGAAHHVWAVGT